MARREKKVNMLLSNNAILFPTAMTTPTKTNFPRNKLNLEEFYS